VNAPTLPRRRVEAFDVIQVRAGVTVGDRRLESVFLTVTAVTPDGAECDATEWTGGPTIHLPTSAFRIVTPPRGGTQ
jgi:hypothetical protein